MIRKTNVQANVHSLFHDAIQEPNVQAELNRLRMHHVVDIFLTFMVEHRTTM